MLLREVGSGLRHAGGGRHEPTLRGAFGFVQVGHAAKLGKDGNCAEGAMIDVVPIQAHGTTIHTVSALFLRKCAHSRRIPKQPWWGQRPHPMRSGAGDVFAQAPP